MGRPITAVAVLLVICALVLRLVNAPFGTFSRDECFSWRMTQFETGELVSRIRQDAHPPLSYLLLKWWAAIGGDSVWWLRAFSALWGCATILLVYEICGFRLARERECALHATSARYVGRLLAALLAGFHALQIEASHNVRMYSLGLVSAALTTWLLLKLACSPSRTWTWAIAYGVAVAAFCYTHYFAFFSIAAQWAGFVLLSWARKQLGIGSGPNRHFAVAPVIAATLFFPWLPAFLDQLQDVHRSFWIPPVSWGALERVFFRWTTGSEIEPGFECQLWLLLIWGVTLWGLLRGPRLGWFFLVQAAVPWIGSIAFSLASGRSIFLERCLVFAQIGLFAAWSVAFRSLRGAWTRVLFCCLVAVPTIYGTASYFWRLPGERPALERVAEILAAEYRPGDVVIVDSPGEVNRIRYYAAQAGLRQIDVKCKRTWEEDSGHVDHLASLEPADIYSSEAELFALVHGRIWCASYLEALRPEMETIASVVSKQRFQAALDPYTLFVLEQRHENQR